MLAATLGDALVGLLHIGKPPIGPQAAPLGWCRDGARRRRVQFVGAFDDEEAATMPRLEQRRAQAALTAGEGDTGYYVPRSRPAGFDSWPIFKQKAWMLEEKRRRRTSTPDRREAARFRRLAVP
jgi:hypothetical protein